MQAREADKDPAQEYQKRIKRSRGVAAATAGAG